VSIEQFRPLKAGPVPKLFFPVPKLFFLNAAGLSRVFSCSSCGRWTFYTRVSCSFCKRLLKKEFKVVVSSLKIVFIEKKTFCLKLVRKMKKKTANWKNLHEVEISFLFL